MDGLPTFGECSLREGRNAGKSIIGGSVGSLGSPSPDIDSGPGFRPDPVVRESGTGDWPGSVLVSGTDFGPGFPDRFLFFRLCPNATARGSLAARAARALAAASSIVAMQPQVTQEGSPDNCTRHRQRERNWKPTFSRRISICYAGVHAGSLPISFASASSVAQASMAHGQGPGARICKTTGL
jgi:hypothetical protein